MLKSLAMKYFPIAILAGLIAAILGMSHYAEIRTYEHRDNAKQVNPTPAVTPDKAAEGSHEAYKAKNPPGWIETFTWPDGVTGWALLLTLLVIAWQSVETRDAARAGLLSAQAMINAERPWIMVTVEEVVGPNGGFNLYMTNKGRTPAMVSGAYMGCVVVTDLSALPSKSPYGPGSMAKNRIVLPDEKLLITWFSGGTLRKIVGNGFPSAPGDGEIYVFGKILYKNLLDPSPNVPHETRWIGLYQLPVGELSDSIFAFQGIGVPDEYDRYS